LKQARLLLPTIHSFSLPPSLPPSPFKQTLQQARSQITGPGGSSAAFSFPAGGEGAAAGGGRPLLLKRGEGGREGGREEEVLLNFQMNLWRRRR